MRRQPSQPFNPSLPECTDLPSFKHKYTDEETEETVFHGQRDTQEASNTVHVLTPVTVTKFAHYQSHKGWCDTELTTNTQMKAEKTATVDSQPYNTMELVDNTQQEQGAEADDQPRRRIVSSTELADNLKNIEQVAYSERWQHDRVKPQPNLTKDPLNTNLLIYMTPE